MKISNLLPLITLLLVPAATSYIDGTVYSSDHATVGNTGSNEKGRILKSEKSFKESLNSEKSSKKSLKSEKSSKKSLKSEKPFKESLKSEKSFKESKMSSNEPKMSSKSIKKRTKKTVKKVKKHTKKTKTVVTESPTRKTVVTESPTPTESPTVELSSSYSPSYFPSSVHVVTESPTRNPVATESPTPTESPTVKPSSSYSPTSSPSSVPVVTESPTRKAVVTESPTPEPSPSNSLSSYPSSVPSTSQIPTCIPKDAVSVCIAIDDSGSICDAVCTPFCSIQCNRLEFGTFCCQAFENGISFVRESLQGIENAKYAQVLKQYSVVVFGSRSTTVQGLTGIVEDAINSIANYEYVGKGTRTEYAINRCQNELNGQPNPVIILVSDGRPEFQLAAVNSATDAASKGISIIPVAINENTSDLEALNALARCSGQENMAAIPCEDNQGLSVDDFDGLSEIIRRLVVKINCSLS